MQLDDSALITALRDARPLDSVCRDAGVSVEQFVAARDAWLRRNASLNDQTIAAPVGGTAVTHEVDNVALPPNIDAVNYNFGEIKGGSLAGFVYVDAQNDGTMDPGDPGIALLPGEPGYYTATG